MVISWGTLEGAVGWTIHILRTRMLSLKQVWRHSSWWSSLGMLLKEWDICLPKMLVLISSAETVIMRYFWMPRVLCWTTSNKRDPICALMILIAMNCGTSEISSMRFQRTRIRVDVAATRIRIFLKPHSLLHKSTFRPHETSKSGHWNRIILKPLSRVWNPFHTNPDKKYAVD